MLEFNIRNQEISRIDNFSPAEKSVEYLVAKFNFKTEDWNEAIKRVVFRNVKSKVEKDTMIEDDSCVVPWEVLVGSGDIEVSVHGVIGTEEITTDVAVFNLNRTLQGGSVTQEPSPTVYAQMVEMVKDAKDLAQSVRDDADNGKFNGPQGDPGKDGKSAYQYAVEGGFKGTEQEFIDSMGKAGQVDLTGYVTKEEHEAELLKAFVKVTTEKAAYYHITDSANMKVLDFGMEGKTEQKTVPGNQLFDISKFKSSAKTTNNGDGSITTSSYNFQTGNYISEVCPNVKVGQTIIVSAKNPGSFIYFGNTVKGFKSAFEVTQEMLDGNHFGFYGISGETDTDNPLTISDIMINEGTVALPIEPYVGGIPSPNPTHPQEIKLAGVLNEETGRYEHKCCVGNKNWVSVDFNDYEKGSYSASTGKKVNNSTSIRLKELVRVSNDYVYVYVDSPVDGVKILLRGYGEDQEFLYNLGNVASGSTRYIQSDTKYLGVILIKEDTTLSFDEWQSVFENGLKVYVGSIDDGTNYTPHASQPFTLTSDRPLTMWDKLVKRDGRWYWDYKQLKLVVDGTYGWYAYTSYNGFAMSKDILPDSAKRREGYCNQSFVYTLSVKENCGLLLGVNNKKVYSIYNPYYDESLEDKGISNWKAHLNEHPLEIYTYKDESELVPLLDEEQELLRNLEMYYGVTNIYNEQGCPMWFKYCADQELHWNQKLLQIQQAII